MSTTTSITITNCYNKVNLTVIGGNLTANPEMRAQDFVTFTLATNVGYFQQPTDKRKNKVWVDLDPVYTDCQVSGPVAKHIFETLKKGDGITVQGSWTTYTPAVEAGASKKVYKKLQINSYSDIHRVSERS